MHLLLGNIISVASVNAEWQSLSIRRVAASITLCSAPVAMMVCGDVNIVCAHAAVMFDMHTIAPPEVTSKETAPIIKHTIESIVRDLAFFSFLTGGINILTARREAMTPRELFVVPTLVVEGGLIRG